MFPKAPDDAHIHETQLTILQTLWLDISTPNEAQMLHLHIDGSCFLP